MVAGMTARHDAVQARAEAARLRAALGAALACLETGSYVKALLVVRNAARSQPFSHNSTIR